MLPIQHRIRATLARTAFTALALAGALACDDPLGPDVARQPVPFYYYENDRIYLQVDGSRLTAVPEVAGDSAAFRAVLGQAGVAVDSIRPMQQQGHWFIHLSAGTPARRAEAAARQLRLDPRVRFASAVYRVPNFNCAFYMVNRLTVQFRPGVDESAVTALNQETGVRNEQAQPWETRTYEYPARMSATPLELAAHYHRQRIVDWAQSDRLDTCFRIDGHSAP